MSSTKKPLYIVTPASSPSPRVIKSAPAPEKSVAALRTFSALRALSALRVYN